MILDPLIGTLRSLAGIDFAQAAMSRTLPPDFSRERLLEELGTLRSLFPATPLRERMFGVPEFLGSAAVSRVREWEISRSALVAAIRGLENQGLDFTRFPSGIRVSFSHTDGVALAIAGSFPTLGGLGLDLEREGREISPAAFARFHRACELEILADRLDHWVLKEAAFKAHPMSAETVVADYEIVDQGPLEGEYSIRCMKGDPVFFRSHVGSIEGYRYALAIDVG